MVIVPAVELPEYPPVMSATFRLSMTVLTVVVMVVGCAGSVCVIALFLSDRCLWKPSYVLIGFLAFVDLLNLGCWGTLKVCFLVYGEFWTGTAGCWISAVATMQLTDTSILITIIIAVNRYLRVCYTNVEYNRFFSMRMVAVWCVVTFGSTSLFALITPVRYYPELPGCFVDIKASLVRVYVVTSLYTAGYCLVALLYCRMMAKVTAIGNRVKAAIRSSSVGETRRNSPVRTELAGQNNPLHCGEGGEDRVKAALRLSEEDRVKAALRLSEEDRVKAALRLSEEKRVKAGLKFFEEEMIKNGRKASEEERVMARLKFAQEERARERRRFLEEERIKAGQEFSVEERFKARQKSSEDEESSAGAKVYVDGRFRTEVRFSDEDSQTPGTPREQYASGEQRLLMTPRYPRADSSLYAGRPLLQHRGSVIFPGQSRQSSVTSGMSSVLKLTSLPRLSVFSDDQNQLPIRPKVWFPRETRLQDMKYGFIACSLNMATFAPFLFCFMFGIMLEWGLPAEASCLSHLLVLCGLALNCVVYGVMNISFQHSWKKLLQRMRAQQGAVTLPIIGIRSEHNSRVACAGLEMSHSSLTGVRVNSPTHLFVAARRPGTDGASSGSVCRRE